MIASPNQPRAARDLYELIHTPSGITLAHRIVRARGFFAQGVGLIGRPELAPGEGLWLDGAGYVHTCGMRFSLDLLLLDHATQSLGWSARVPPNRLFVGRWGARSAIELAAGALEKIPQLALGDKWLLQPASPS